MGGIDEDRFYENLARQYQANGINITGEKLKLDSMDMKNHNKQNMQDLSLISSQTGKSDPNQIYNIPKNSTIPSRTVQTSSGLAGVSNTQSVSPEDYYDQNKDSGTDKLVESMEVLGRDGCMGIILFIQKEGKKVQATDNYPNATGEISVVTYEEMDEAFFYGANIETTKLQGVGIIEHHIPTQTYYITDWGARVLRSMDAAGKIQEELDSN